MRRPVFVALALAGPVAATILGFFLARWLYSTGLGASLPQGETRPFFILAMGAMLGTTTFMVLVRVGVEHWKRWK